MNSEVKRLSDLLAGGIVLNNGGEIVKERSIRPSVNEVIGECLSTLLVRKGLITQEEYDELRISLLSNAIKSHEEDVSSIEGESLKLVKPTLKEMA